MSDDRMARLAEFKRELFPERVCPDCGDVGEPVLTSQGRPPSGTWHYCRALKKPEMRFVKIGPRLDQESGR